MKNRLLLVLSFSVLTIISCKLSKKSDGSIRQEVDLIQELSATIDSLQRKGIDTMVIFSSLCSGCIPDTEEKAYIFWKKSKNENYVFKITNEVVYEKAVTLKDVINYFFDQKSQIINKKLNLPEIDMSHYKYVKVDVFVDNKKIFERRLSDLYRTQSNSNNEFVRWIYQIESSLYAIESSNLKQYKGW